MSTEGSAGFDNVGLAVHPTELRQVNPAELRPIDSVRNQLLTLSIHDSQVSKDDFILNLPQNIQFNEGDLLALKVTSQFRQLPGKFSRESSQVSTQICLLFSTPNPDVLSKQPMLQVSVSQQVAAAFDIEKGNQVSVSLANQTSYHASHVEIVFRDQYLARADMWRLVSTMLIKTCVYKGQKLEFLGSIRAQIKSLYVQGKKVQSAFFHSATKPIFRSESARYVLFIQMSKEMWDFDAEGSGEIMFDKVINGFLPELFKRWHDLKVKHLVSIVLFTRMVYDRSPPGTGSIEDDPTKKHSSSGQEMLSRDFYRVVISDMASGDWAGILNQLKKEFKVFLKDISIREPEPGDHRPLADGIASALQDTPHHVIAGRPTVAMHGNILEAIDLASSQFSSDYIDRDLVRTGVSIVVISPGTGVYEVDYDRLVATTATLVDNGVGIDLVCLSRMPLHSVPLFRYQPPLSKTSTSKSQGQSQSGAQEETPSGSLRTSDNSGTPPALRLLDSDTLSGPTNTPKLAIKHWNFGIPHWIDVSYWAPPGDSAPKQQGIRRRPIRKSGFDAQQHKSFVPRVRMYEIQMMGVMENAISDVSIPQLPKISRAQLYPSDVASVTMASSPKAVSTLSTSFSSSLPRSHVGSLPPSHVEEHASRHSRSLVSAQSRSQDSSVPQLQWMDHYDDLVFRHPIIAKKRTRKTRSSKLNASNQPRVVHSPSSLGTSAGNRGKHFMDQTSTRVVNKAEEIRPSDSDPIGRSALQVKEGPVLEAGKAGRPSVSVVKRNISFGPRGFSTKAVASTEVTTQHGKGSLLGRSLKPGASVNSSSKANTADVNTDYTGDTLDPHQYDAKSSEVTQSSESESQLSRPIPIRHATAKRISKDYGLTTEKLKQGSQIDSQKAHLHERLAALQNVQDIEEEVLMVLDCDDNQPIQPTLSPSATLAPWLTILNPSNPSKTRIALASRLGRWQHLFPKPLSASQIKWKSLCSPAAVPLTTEEFPSAEQLAEEYDAMTYDIDISPRTDQSEAHISLLTELLAFRLSRGFQIVIGPSVEQVPKNSASQKVTTFTTEVLEDTGDSLYITRGETIQKMTRLETNQIQIQVLSRRSSELAKHNNRESSIYRPLIRSMMADQYEVQEIAIMAHRSDFDWKVIDSFIVGHDRPQARDFVDNLRPWRTRYVLIPVDTPSISRRLPRSDEDDEEEIRLEGIRKLTQVWQRFKYIPPDERRYQAPLRTRKDTNPLDIMYQTRNPSEIVVAERENVGEGDAVGGPVQLLPDSDLYERSNFKLSALAETIQGDKGVRMLDRRWHLRLHYNCFIGFEMTTWLLQNFRDVDTRDEAVGLGNELMKNGLFKHVEQRHNFRDGNYFYQIADDYRAPKQETRGWFGRAKASIPPTPVSEDLPSKESPMTGRSRSSSQSNKLTDDDLATPTVKQQQQQLGVALSKSLLYDVDHRKRSYRPELVNLHYDRLHNPDNCYHIRVEWMNTTPKLIQDAVVSWATSVDRFGLRLVEVPIGEASSVTSMHPFRAPFKVELAHPPPSKQPQGYFDSPSLAAQPQIEKHFYQKAVMKRFNFVLDFEAASDFPADVDVTYSWGKPDYQFPQYIHRSGMIIAQITDEGHFLLLANRLYNNRSMTNSTRNQATSKSDHLNDMDHGQSPGFYRSSPRRGTHGPPHRVSPRSSNTNSPSIRAALDIPSPVLKNTSRYPSVSPSGPVNSALLGPDPSHTGLITAESIKEDFETFCSNTDVLKAFYEDVLNKATASGPNTPFVKSKTPHRGPETGWNEIIIPTLSLPGSVIGNKADRANEKKTEAKTKTSQGKDSVVGENSTTDGPS